MNKYHDILRKDTNYQIDLFCAARVFNQGITFRFALKNHISFY